MPSTTAKRVAVGLSGGVDSSVAAALLKKQGYEVIGLMLRLWSNPGAENRCCAPDAVVEARRIAGQLDIPFYVIDAKEAFYQQVVEPFVNGYAQGVTPNPCLRCNRHIRWNFLLSRARALGAGKIATGHYARLRQLPSGEVQLLKNPDPDKDQSYFLHVLSQRELASTVFPLAELSKAEVRELAREFSLASADRPDSQDLCFVGQVGDYREFLHQIDPLISRPGPIQDASGQVIGQHEGLASYTIGQRKGLGISGPEPYYVLRKDPSSNTLVIGFKADLGQERFSTHATNWISGTAPDGPLQAEVKVRYQSSPVPGLVHPQGEGETRVQLAKPLPDITPGQAAVFYQGDVCLGGGIISLEVP